VFVLEDDRSWALQPIFTITVVIWFILSLAVKVSMVLDRMIELLNLVAIVAYLSIAFTYYPHPGYYTSFENFCYYLHFSGGLVCDVCDFFYESVSRRPEDQS
jgi:hypothetical protein